MSEPSKPERGVQGVLRTMMSISVGLGGVPGWPVVGLVLCLSLRCAHVLCACASASATG